MDLECIWAVSDFLNAPQIPSIGEEDAPPPCALAAALRVDLGLSESEAECIEESPDVMEIILDYSKNNSVINPCSPGESTQDILHDAISNACSSGGIEEIADIYEGFPATDHIVIFGGIENYCPRLACLLNKLKDQELPQESSLCEMFNNLHSDDLVIYMGLKQFNAPQYNPSATAGTRISEGTLIIEFNSNKCELEDRNILDLLDDIQHELVHVDIDRVLLDDYNWDGNPSTKLTPLQEWLGNDYESNSDYMLHRYMLENYLADMVSTYIELNDGQGTYNDFVAHVMNGIPADLYSYIEVTPEGYTALYQQYLNYISVARPITTNLNECEE
jgi:hypothetical protein